MEVQKRVLSDGTTRWRVRWREAGHYRARTFDRKGDAIDFGADLRRRRQFGTLGSIDSGRVALSEYVAGTWAKAYRVNLSEKTRLHYGQLYDTHVLPALGALPLRDLTPEHVARWQADRIAAGAG
ncbi:MAG: N-terminal phage integrase SAM-like domain-containing protein, partial [Solirubrobacteraceae bacterium]